MLRLLRFELNKIYSQKSIYVMFALMMAFILLTMNTDRNKEQELYKEHQPWEGKITVEEVAELEKYRNEVNEQRLNYGTVTNSEWSLFTFSDIFTFRTNKAIEREQEINILSNIIDNSTSPYEKRQAELKIKMLSNIDTSNFYYQKGPAFMLDYIFTFGFVMTAFLTVIGISPIFSREYSTGMDQFLLSSKYGRSKAITAKLLATMIFVLSVVLIWNLYSFGASLYTFGMHGWQSALQSVYTFVESPYALNLIESFGWMLFVHIIAALTFGLITVLISAFSKKVMITLLASGMIFGIPLVFDVILEYPKQKWLLEILDLSIYRFMKVKELFIGFNSYNLFGFPVLHPLLAVVLSVIIGVVCWYLTKWLFKRKQVTV